MTEVKETHDEMLLRKKKGYLRALQRLTMMKFYQDKDGYIHFNEIFYQLLQIAFKPLYEKNANPKSKLFLKELRDLTSAALFKRNYKIQTVSCKRVARLLSSTTRQKALHQLRTSPVFQNRNKHSLISNLIRNWPSQEKKVEQNPEEVVKEVFPLNDYVFLLATFRSWLSCARDYEQQLILNTEERKQQARQEALKTLFRHSNI